MPSPEQQAPERAAELRELDAAVAEALEPKSKLPSLPDDAEDLSLAGSYVYSPMKMWYVRCVYGKPDEWAPIMFSVFADAALAAYEVMRKRGWKIVSCHEFWAEDGWIVRLERIGGGESCCSGGTFPEALSRAIVATAKQEAH